jgi:translation initiation factor IF-1
MVKNTSGGNKSKGFARKNIVKRDGALRVAKDEGEIYAQAVKVMGGSIASAIDIDGNPLRAHIRGKFRGRGKRDNFIGPGTWLLVGLHAWESDKSEPKEIRNCDILEVYNDSDKTRLKNSVTSVNWSKFIANDSKSISCSEPENNDNGVTFADDAAQEYEELIAAEAAAKGSSKTIVLDDGDIIDVEDI